MDKFIEEIKNCNTIEGANTLLYANIKKSDLLEKAFDIADFYHKDIERASGEKYIVHPLLVAALVAYLDGSEDMVVAAILHDIVEDSDCSVDEIENKFNSKVATLVDGLTKINASEKSYTSALSLGKLLEFAKESPEVLIVKLCDRVHNMLTLDALPLEKRQRIAKESLHIYSGIAHKLGMDIIKRVLEDYSFMYLQPKEYQKIKSFVDEHSQELHLKLNNFVVKVEQFMFLAKFKRDDFKIEKRIKHFFSIHQKLKRKSISIDEVTDLLAIRILVKESIDCYRALGAVQLRMEPMIARFKDYIANPKENGYQTLHTMFFYNGSIVETQIRTFDMHSVAEHGIAAHWKYKGKDVKIPNLSWINDTDYHNKVDKELIMDSYDNVQYGLLYKNDITVYSKDGEKFIMPAGSKALDYAYRIHSELGDMADKAYINKEPVPLLSPMKNGDEVRILPGKTAHYKCSWIDDLVTPKARRLLRHSCRNKIKEIDTKVGRKILRDIFKADRKSIIEWLKRENIYESLYKVPRNSEYLIAVTNYIKKYTKNTLNPFRKKDRFKPLKQKFTNIVVYSNYNIKDLCFDDCCNPRRGDDIIGFRKKDRVIVHHKMCDNAEVLMDMDEPMIFVKWTKDIPDSYSIIFALEDRVASLAELLRVLAKNEINLVQINSQNDLETRRIYFQAVIEKRDSKPQDIKDIVKNSCKLINFKKVEDPYRL